MRKVLQCPIGQCSTILLVRNQILYLLAGAIESTYPLTVLGRSWVIRIGYQQYAHYNDAGRIFSLRAFMVGSHWKVNIKPTSRLKEKQKQLAPFDAFGAEEFE